MPSWFQPHTHFFMIYGEIFDVFCGADLVMRTLDESLIVHLETLGYRTFFGLTEINQQFSLFAYNLNSLEWFNFSFQTQRGVLIAADMNYTTAYQMVKKLFERGNKTVLLIKSTLFAERLVYAHFDELMQWECAATHHNLILFLQPMVTAHTQWQGLIQPAKHNLIQIGAPQPDEIFNISLRVQLAQTNRSLITGGSWRTLTEQAFQLYAQFLQNAAIPLKRLNLFYAALRKKSFRTENNPGLYAFKNLVQPQTYVKVKHTMRTLQQRLLQERGSTVQRLLPPRPLLHGSFHHLCLYSQLESASFKAIITRLAHAYCDGGLLSSKNSFFLRAPQLLGQSIEETENRTRQALQKAAGGIFCVVQLELLLQEVYGQDVIRMIIQSCRDTLDICVVCGVRRGMEHDLNQLDPRIFDFFLPKAWLYF